MTGDSRTARASELLPPRMRPAMLAVFVGFLAIGVSRAAPDSVAVVVAATAVALGAAVLMVRARRTLPLLGCAALATAGIAVLGTGVSNNIGWFAVCLLCGWCLLVGGRRAGAAYWAGAMALFGGEWLWAEPDPGWGAWMAGITLTALFGLLVRHERDLVAQLRAAQAGLAERARAEERNRIARELHDVIAHTLTVSLLHVTSARLTVEYDPEDAARALAEAERLGRESLAEVRSAVGLLRPDGKPEEPGTTPLPGIDGLPGLVDRFRSAGAAVTLTIDGDTATLPATTGLAVYRIAQEALTNTVKHAAGTATDVRLWVGPDAVELAVDSGGAPGQGTGLGLLSMRERAESLGGSCDAGPGGRGWLVRASLPLGAARRPAGTP